MPGPACGTPASGTLDPRDVAQAWRNRVQQAQVKRTSQNEGPAEAGEQPGALPHTPACAPPHLHHRTAATAARLHTVITYTRAGLTLELELGLLGGPRLSKLPNHAGQTLPHYAAAAAAPAGRSATMRGGGLTYPASIGAAAKPRHTARRSPRVGWAVSAQGWPRASPDMVEPVNAQRAAKPAAAPTPQPQPQQPRMRQPSPSKGQWQPQQQQPLPQQQQQQQRRQQASRPSSAAPTVSARPVAAASHQSHRAAAAARPQSAAMHRPHGASTAVVARPQSAGGNHQRPPSAGVDTPRRAAVVRPQSASERRAETAERELLLGVSGNRALMLCATIVAVVVSVVIVSIGHRAHRQLPTPTVAASSVHSYSMPHVYGRGLSHVHVQGARPLSTMALMCSYARELQRKCAPRREGGPTSHLRAPDGKYVSKYVSGAW